MPATSQARVRSRAVATTCRGLPSEKSTATSICGSVSGCFFNFSASAAIVPTAEKYDLLPGNIDLTAAEIRLMDESAREQRLKNALLPIRGNYDYIIIDCPPSLSLLTLNALAVADGVIVPMQCEYFALEGLSDLVNTIKQVHANLNPALEVIGILRVMFDTRITLQSQVSEQLKAHFGDRVFDTVIPRNVRLAEAPSYGMPGLVFDPASKGALAFLDFARELAARAEARFVPA